MKSQWVSTPTNVFNVKPIRCHSWKLLMNATRVICFDTKWTNKQLTVQVIVMLPGSTQSSCLFCILLMHISMTICKLPFEIYTANTHLHQVITTWLNCNYVTGFWKTLLRLMEFFENWVRCVFDKLYPKTNPPLPLWREIFVCDCATTVKLRPKGVAMQA